MTNSQISLVTAGTSLKTRQFHSYGAIDPVCQGAIDGPRNRGAPRPEVAAAGPYRAALPRARAPPAAFSVGTAVVQTRRGAPAHPGYGPMARTMQTTIRSLTAPNRRRRDLPRGRAVVRLAEPPP